MQYSPTECDNLYQIILRSNISYFLQRQQATGTVFSVRQETKFWLFFSEEIRGLIRWTPGWNFVRWKQALCYECCLTFWCSFSTGYPAVDSIRQLNYWAGCWLRDQWSLRWLWNYKVSRLHREVCSSDCDFFLHCIYMFFQAFKSKLQLLQSREFSPWKCRQKMSPKRLKQKSIWRFVKHQKDRLLKNFPPYVIEIIYVFIISVLFRRWTIIWIQITQKHTLDSTELFHEPELSGTYYK